MFDRSNVKRLVVFIALTILLALRPLPAQEYRGTVTGLITDPSGAAVPGAEVTLTNLLTSIAVQTRSTDAGVYTFRLVQPGRYRISARQTGFREAVVPEIVVQTGAAVTADLRLEVGDLLQSVEVRADAPLLNTASADSGQVIDETRILALPMNGRSPFALARLAPGVIAAGMLNETKPYDMGGNSYISIAGSRRYSVEFSLNGIPNSASAGLFSGFLAYTPPVDATQEFRVVTNGFDAQYGHNGSGVVTVTTKSGTNEFHGSLYEFLQNDKLNANNFFSNLAGRARPPRRYNQFGGTLGGPVWLPKLVDGRNKLFFFFGYEGIRNAQPSASFATVPTEAMRGGDLSPLLARNVTVYDPFSVTEGPSGTVVRAPLPNNRIPADRINPIARNMLSYVPLPNTGGAGAMENNYFITRAGRYDVYNNYLGRLDLQTSSAGRLFLSVGHYSLDVNSADLFQTLATGGGEQWPMWNAALDYTHMLGPAWLLNGRLGVMRYTQDYIPKSKGFDPATLGFPRSFTGQLVGAGYFPRVDMVHFTGFGTGARTTHYIEHTYTYFTSITASHFRSRHGLRFGWEAREKRTNGWNSGNASSGFLFNGQFAAGPGLTAGTGFGHDFATFLMGLPSDGSVDINSHSSMRGRYHAFFLQDDWRVSPTLTLNLGFRYDIESPGYEKYNRIVTGWLTGSNPIEAQAIRNYAANPDPALPVSEFRVRGGLLYPGQEGVPNSTWDREWGRWQPRAGLAWAPEFLRRRVSFRIGGGISYFSLTIPPGISQAGFSATTPFVATIDNGRTFVATLSNPFPAGLNQPRGPADGPLTFLGQSVTAFKRDVVPTRNNRWQASIQVQVTQSDMLEINYTGSTQNHLPAAMPLNYVPARFTGTSVTRDQAAIDFLSAPVRNPFQGLIPAATALGRATISRAQLLYAFPHFTAVSLGNDNCGSITFHSAYFSWERRMSRGLAILANYMISKQLIANVKLNPQDTRLHRIPGPEDRPQQLSVSGIWDIPVGRNRAFGSRMPAIVDYILGGWQISGIFFAQSGNTIAWGPMVFLGNSWNDIKAVPGGRSIARWFNTDVFDRTAARQPNTAYQFRYFPLRVGPVRAPGVNSFDIAVTKNFRISERSRLELRGDFFNVRNHPNFGGPNTSPTSALFGQITSQANLPRVVQLGLRLAF
jgi:hypothetical protein